MKTVPLVSTLATLFLPIALFAGSDSGVNTACCEERSCPQPCCKEPCQDSCFEPCSWRFEFRSAAYLPLKSQHRDIYGSALPSIQFQWNYTLCRDWCCCDELSLYFNVAWVFKSGETKGFGYCSKLDLVPLAFGLEYAITFCCDWDFYIGLAPTYSFLRIRNNDGFDRACHDHGAFGVMTKTGFRYTFSSCVFLDIFADYYYTRFDKMHDSIQNIHRDFSAFFVGAGIGYRW
jgi:hypothetical protein